MAPHSSTLAWKIPWMEGPGGLQSMGSWRVRHDWAISLSLFTFMHWRRKWQPTPVFLPGNPRDGGAWWAAVSGVAQSRTRLKWLSIASLLEKQTEEAVWPQKQRLKWCSRKECQWHQKEEEKRDPRPRNRLTPAFWPSVLRQNKWCFKPLKFAVICYSSLRKPKHH